VEVAGRLLAVQGQDPRGVRLAIRARSDGLTAADVDRALTEERSLVISWLNRGTLHLVRSEDYRWLHALTAPPQVTGILRRLRQEGVDAAAMERGVAAMERALAREGPLTRAQVAERVAAAGVRIQGQALVLVIALACLRGLAVRGPMRGRDHAYALVSDWLPASRTVDRDRALAELARRYLAGHAPAGERDLARWAGLPLRDARAGLNAIASELAERRDGLVEPAGRTRRATRAKPPPRLLGAFDPVLLGWISREALLGEHAPVVTVGGMFVPFALVGGRAAALWRLAGKEVALEPLRRLTGAERKALEQDAADVLRFLTPPA
jgi:hypothetical protein